MRTDIQKIAHLPDTRIIVHNSDFGYLLIPKNGSSAVRTTYEFEYMSLLSEYEELKLSKKVFSIIRNPFERFITGYIETFRRYDISIKNNNNPELSYLKYYKDITDERQRLIEFIKDCKGSAVEAHVEHQSNILKSFTPDNLFLYDYNLNEDINTFMDENNFIHKPLVQWRKQSLLNKENVFKLIDKQILKLYFETYKEDIEMFFYFSQLRKVKGSLIDKNDITNYFKN